MNDKYSVIKKIRRVSNTSDSKHIRSKIIDSLELETLEKLLALDNNSSADVVDNIVDVPVQNIISINRIDDTWLKGDCWLDVLNHRLHGEGWEEKVFDYFEKEIDEKEFPAPGARGYLELKSYNGLIGCLNGNHRLIAGVCLLASRYGDSKAVLKNVHLYMISFDKKNLLALKELYRTCDCGIKFFNGTSSDCQKSIKEDKIIMIDEKLYVVSNKDSTLLFELIECEDYKKYPIPDNKYWVNISNYTLQKLFSDKQHEN